MQTPRQMVRRAYETTSLQKLAEQALPWSYRIQARLGRGSNGIVYRARNILANTSVALKVVENANLGPRLQYSISNFERIRFINHPNVLRLYETTLEGNNLFVVMEEFEKTLGRELLNATRVEER